MDVENEGVNWWVVIGAIFLAVVTGLVVGAVFMAVSAGLFLPKMAIVVAPLATALFYYGLYRLAWRRYRRDLAVGLLIGGCLIALAVGACGYLLVNIH